MSKGNAIPVRIEEEEAAVLEDLHKRTGLSRAEIMRRSVRLLNEEVLRRGSASFILDLIPLSEQFPSLLRVAEEPPAYGQRQSQRQSTRRLAHVETDAEGLVTAINPAFTAMCGYTLRELRGKKPGTLLQGRATERAAVEAMRRAIRQRVPCTVALLNYHKDGSPYRVRIEMRPRFHGRTLAGFEADEEVIDS